MENIQEEKEMKKLMYMGITVAIILTIAGCSKSLKVEPVKQLTVEYGDKLDNAKLFDASKSDKDIKVSKVDGFDSKKLGSEKVKVTFTDKDDKTKVEKEITIEVIDTKAPVVEFNKDEVTVEQNKNVDLKKNIKSVKDPVDGDIKYSKSKVEKDGYYFDEGNLDTKKTGTHEVKVIAYDKNKNKAEKSFKVIVKENEKEAKASEKENTDNTNKGTSSGTTQNNGASKNGGTKAPASQGQSNGGGNTPSKQPSQQQKPQKPSKPACDPNEIPAANMGNSGMIFNSIHEARIWGTSQMNDKKSPFYMMGFDTVTVFNACNENTNKVTVDFY